MFVGVLAPTIHGPDKGSTLIIGATLIVMGYLAGMDQSLDSCCLSRHRGGVCLTMTTVSARAAVLNPWSDRDPTVLLPVTSGFYALDRAGSLQRGIGMR